MSVEPLPSQSYSDDDAPGSRSTESGFLLEREYEGSADNPGALYFLRAETEGWSCGRNYGGILETLPAEIREEEDRLSVVLPLDGTERRYLFLRKSRSCLPYPGRFTRVPLQQRY